ncbi:DUF1853 family protein [Massilia endophytica]|uniref:DUF1853 family protein n=1 Tax=Massilia endophytica TaxID=2899220 RepID=UPI001E326A4F|nr:DUF1853 family protein [Massilia endophytica]UGQ48061.1 DUF1853 family protein [Massilia endophytica]
MPDAADSAADTCQARFGRRWPQLTRPHVRALAWLLDSPDLLDPDAPQWQSRIATLGPASGGIADWLNALERDPAPLDAALGGKVYSRLGLYAEKLMAFYFEQQGRLEVHGLQVRAARNDTVGEFDFLLREPDGLRHIEFACKFYLLDGGTLPDRLVGPNLADTLGLKMRKILDQQLSLAEHPAAQAMLAQRVVAAQALVKGWLFYPRGAIPSIDGISPGHCHGHWEPLRDFAAEEEEGLFMVLPKLQWLAPLKLEAAGARAHSRSALHRILDEKFAIDPSPVLAAQLREEDGWLVETARGFIVPDDWRHRADARRASGALPG